MQFRPVKEQLDILLRGVIEVVPRDFLEKKLQASYDRADPCALS
jgi:tyrosyl-tRNA synthetase